MRSLEARDTLAWRLGAARWRRFRSAAGAKLIGRLEFRARGGRALIRGAGDKKQFRRRQERAPAHQYSCDTKQRQDGEQKQADEFAFLLLAGRAHFRRAAGGRAHAPETSGRACSAGGRGAQTKPQGRAPGA